MADVANGNYMVDFSGQRGLFIFKDTKGGELPDDLRGAYTKREYAHKALEEYTRKAIEKAPSGKRTSK